jgi:nucleotide-binding universal stress UspA family protein
MYAEFKTILVATDGSQGGLDAAALAVDLAAPGVDVVIADLGPRATELHERVQAHGADLLVVGARSRGSRTACSRSSPPTSTCS